MLVDAQGEAVLFEVEVDAQLPVELIIDEVDRVNVRIVEAATLQDLSFGTDRDQHRLFILVVAGLNDDTLDAKQQEPQSLSDVTLISVQYFLPADLNLSHILVKLLMRYLIKSGVENFRLRVPPEL